MKGHPRTERDAFVDSSAGEALRRSGDRKKMEKITRSSLR
jgi:hypothetical protein